MSIKTWQNQGYSGGYSNSCRKRRLKTDWAGVRIGDAFKSNLDYFLRLSAQRLFYRLARKAQTDLAKMTGAGIGEQLQPMVKPQLSPCYTTYPSTLAAYAAIGLTVFLEFKARVHAKVLYSKLQAYLDDPAGADEVAVDPASYKTVAQILARWVETRLLMEDISRSASLAPVEIYRLFSASQENLRYKSLAEIIRSVILYGDVLPNWEEMNLHPLTRSILADLTETSQPFFEVITYARGSQLVSLGVKWVRSACIVLSEYLPLEEKKTAFPSVVLYPPQFRKIGARQKPRFVHDQPPAGDTQDIAPLDGPAPPLLMDPENAAQHISNPVTSPGSYEQENGEPEVQKTSEALSDFAEAVQSAGGQHSQWEDMRSDVLANALRISPFHESPIQGHPVDGHVVTIKMGDDGETSGEIFDKSVELSDDLPTYERLLEESRPITMALKKNLYPNIEQKVHTQHLCVSGSLDPARLALADVSSTIFKRYRIREKADPRGRPVLVIACDGSGSLNNDQMKMLKLLTTGYLESTAKRNIQVLAGLYHSGHIRKGVSGPLVQWIHHPQKTPATSGRDSVRALVSLPDTGTGAQSDALSLAFIMDEAKRVARGDMIYLILITDTAWNRSFHTEKNGQEEVRFYFETAYKELAKKLHTILVALGVSGETGFEDLLDLVITVSTSELKDYSAVAERIGLHVASCIRERSRLIAKR